MEFWIIDSRLYRQRTDPWDFFDLINTGNDKYESKAGLIE